MALPPLVAGGAVVVGIALVVAANRRTTEGSSSCPFATGAVFRLGRTHRMGTWEGENSLPRLPVDPR